MLKELQETLSKRLEEWFTVKDIIQVNHKPHPFVLSSNHIVFAKDNYGGAITNTALEDKRCPPCAHPGCTLSYTQHTSDTVLFLQLVKNITNDEANKVFQPIGEILQQNKIDGIAFVDTPEKYRII